MEQLEGDSSAPQVSESQPPREFSDPPQQSVEKKNEITFRVLYERLISFARSSFELWKSSPQRPILALGGIGLLIVVVLLFSNWSIGNLAFFVPNSNYAPIYELVSDTVSKNGVVVVNLPDGTPKEGAEGKVRFEPSIGGSWVDSSLEDAVVYKPAKELTQGSYYRVLLELDSGVLKKDFRVDDDPRVADIFPSNQAEADEGSAITIVFSRPMVPLSTLSETELSGIPVMVQPQTEGRFKWITTRTLQFIPETTLAGSANYSVSVNEGFVSMDGLPVPPLTHTFMTRKLAYLGGDGAPQQIGYKDPIVFRFNQAVDIEKTKSSVTVVDRAGRRVPVIVTYGTRVMWDDRNEERRVEDPSVLEIRNADALRGNEGVWEFSESYRASIGVVYPRGGDMLLEGGLFAPAVELQVETGPLLNTVDVHSEATDLADEGLFDPKGTVTFAFHEEIDLRKSAIAIKGLKKLTYGESCVEEERFFFGGPCKKREDRKTLIATFEETAFSRGEVVPVVFESLVSGTGYQINREPIMVELRVYPTLEVLRMSPKDKDTNASLKDLYVCTNVPLKAGDAEQFKKSVRADNYLVFGSWENPFEVNEFNYNYYASQQMPCKVGEYVNHIRYGLHPTKQYMLTMAFEDVFNQHIQKKASFRTQEADTFYLRFQSLQKMYNVTTPEKTKLTFATENFEYVELSICKVTPTTMIRILHDRPDDVSTRASVGPCIETKSDTIELREDTWVNQYFQVNVQDYFDDPRGHYVLTFSHPKYIAQNWEGERLYARSYLSVTNVGFAAESVAWTKYDYRQSDVKAPADPAVLGGVYWVTDLQTLKPHGGAKVSVFQSPDYDDPPTLVRSGITDERGIAEFPLIADMIAAIAEVGNDAAILTKWADTLGDSYWTRAYERERVYLYSDRPIYRPGQEVFIKGIHRLDFDNLFRIVPGAKATLIVRDSRYEEVFTQEVSISAYGTFSTKIQLPLDAPLGTYTVSMDRAGSMYFDVAEYVGAAFEANAASSEEEYIAGDTATVDLSARYYFGVPVDGGKVSYELTAQDFYFDRYTDEYFTFGNDWYSCYFCGYGDSFVTEGKTKLDESGKARISEVLDFEKFFREDQRNQSKLFSLRGVVKDKQGRSVAFRTSFIVHRGTLYLGAKADPSFSEVSKPISLRVKSVDVEGTSVSKSDITLGLFRVEWDWSKRQEVDGGFYASPEKKLEPVLSKTVATSFLGNYAEQFIPREPGQYELQVSTKDSRGNVLQSTSNLYVYGEGSVSVRPTNNATLDLTTEKKDLNVGERARVLIQSPFESAKALVAVVRGRIFSYDIIDVKSNFHVYEFPITPEHAPNVYASVMLLSPEPQAKFGTLEFMVDRASHALTVSVEPSKKSYLPGERVTLAITTSDASGRRVPASVSVSVADLSVLALKGNPKKDPIQFFYAGRELGVNALVNVKNVLEEVLIPTGTKGGGGGSPEDLATRKRGEFRDTAYWQAEVITDQNGYAQVSFDLPDNLTTWQVESLGITKDTKVGVDYESLVAQKKVMAVPLRPRFIVPGDEFMIGAKIFNQTESSQSLAVTLQSETLTILGDGAFSRTVPAHGNETVYVRVRAPEGMTEGEHVFVLSAKNAGYNDTVEQRIPIVRNTTYEATATQFATSEESATEFVYLPNDLLKDRGGLTLKASATLAVYTTDALAYLFEYPYGCSEQLASKLSAIAIAKRAYAIPNAAPSEILPPIEFRGEQYTADQAVQIGLEQIYENQVPGGGFSYYKGLLPNPYLTAQVLTTLLDLKEAGFSVREDVLNTASAFLYKEVQALIGENVDTDSLIVLSYPLARYSGSAQWFSQLLPEIMRRASARNLADSISSATLGTLALMTVEANTSAQFKNSVFGALQNRVTIDARGAYVKPLSSNIGWQYYETPEKNTAQLIKALAKDKREYVETPNLIRWLVAGRAKDGSWGSTNTTVAAIDAFADYIEWKEETSSEFSLRATLGDREILQTTFTQDTVMDVVETFLPISEIAEGMLHTLTFSKTNLNDKENTFYYDASLVYYLPVENIGPRDEGVSISRAFYALTDAGEEKPLTDVAVGDVVRGKLTFIVPKQRTLFTIEDIIPAGFELVDFSLDTELDADSELYSADTEGLYGVAIDYESSRGSSLFDSVASLWHSIVSATGSVREGAIAEEKKALVYTKFTPEFTERHDDRLLLFSEGLRPGAYSYEYYVRATTPGNFSHMPAVASDLYFPENFGRTAGSRITVSQ